MQHVLARARTCSRAWLPTWIRAIIALVAVAIVILACGDTNTGVEPSPFNPTATHRPGPTATPSPSQFVVPNPTASTVVGDIALHLIGLDGVFPEATLGATCQSEPVFTTSKPTSLSAADLGQIRWYLAQLPTEPGGMSFPSPAVQPPTGLNWVPKGNTCTVRLEVTNVTKKGGNAGHPIGINGLDLRLQSPPSPAPVPPGGYPLVDICTVVSSLPACSGGIGAQGIDDVYLSTIELLGGSKGLAFSGQLTVAPIADPKLYTVPFILSAGQTRDIDLTVTVPAGTALAYRVVPELQVDDGSSQVLPFSSLTTDLTFAQVPPVTKQWPCYGLLANPNRVVPDNQIKYGPKQQPVCI